MATYDAITNMILATIVSGFIHRLTERGGFFKFIREFYNWVASWLKKKDKLHYFTIYATKSTLMGGHNFSFPIEYNAVLHKMLKNNIKIKKIVKSIDNNSIWFFSRDEKKSSEFYIDPNDNNETYLIEPNINVSFSQEFERGGKDEAPVQVLKIIISSEKHSVTNLNEIIKKWKNEYIDEIETYKDDGKLYYFSMKDDKEKYEDSTKTKNDENKNKNPSSNISASCWKKNIMVSHKTFNNTFFTDKKILLKKLNYFLNNENLYQDRGIPYNIGFLLHGAPGCGKTSTIKAIANLTKRHIVEVNLNKIKTCGEFERIFLNNMMDDSYIPHDKKIIVLEDIDCMLEIVKSREQQNPKEVSEEYSVIDNTGSDFMKMIAFSELMAKKGTPYKGTDKLSLSCILNTIDGVLENYGRILIITTNYPDKLDSALIRPGRIDMKINFSKCDNETCHDIINHFFKNENKKIYQDIIFPDNKYTPAEILEICSLYYDEFDKVVEKLKEKVVEK
jgi:SpoVK/Ycf46/Vps4 family AAA+-type ATPase